MLFDGGKNFYSKIILFAISGLIMLSFYRISYVGSLISIRSFFLAIWIMAAILFNFRSKIIFLSFFLLLAFCLLLTLLRLEEQAQTWGNYAFPVILLGLFKFFLEYKNEIKID